ncbi:MAG: NlpC/P60 family protein [Lachnospiraceae bacterium]|nr:NlpC/P60 family protein [Lachnospiraceae bacterium]MCD7842549.1 NlpC/P60 family protein [Lachnospiraceae bacterium]
MKVMVEPAVVSEAERRGRSCALLRKTVLMAVFALALLFLTPGVRSEAAWVTTQNGVMYTTSDSVGYAVGLVTIDDARYYFNESGIMQTGVVTVGSKLYYFAADGKMQYGWITDAATKKKYYADKSTGMLYVSKWYGKYYLQSDGTMAVSKWIGNKWVNSKGKYTGKRKTGFVTLEGKTYYYKTKSKYSTGWFKVSGKYYYANSKGVVQKSTWVGKKYVNSKGVMVTGKKTIGSNTYIFKSSGVRYASCWVKYSGKYYYCNSSGVVQKSKWISSGKYYVNSNGVRVTGWQTIDGKKYYFSSKGVKQTGVKKISSKFYYLGSDGVLVANGWASADYYANSSGVLLTGLQAIDGEIYYFDTGTAKKVSGTKKKIGSSTYYFRASSGCAIRSTRMKITESGTVHWYYFGSDGKMVTSTWVNQYYYGSSGYQTSTRSTGWFTTGTTTYYLTDDYETLTGLQTIDGYTYYFDSSGIMQTGLQTIGSYKYYFYSDGKMATSTTITVGSVTYTIGSDGKVTAEEGITASGSTLGSQIANYALQFVGNPYKYGGSSLTSGADCSGFTMAVFAHFGITLPHIADSQMKGISTSVTPVEVEVSTDSLLPGDLLFYGTSSYASHVAIYIGNGQIVHASNSQAYPAGGIKISNYNYKTPVKALRYWS